jgi:hypothetical protein
MPNAARPRPKAEHGPLQLLETEPGACCTGSWANLTITRWQGRGTGPAVERVAKVSAEVRAQYPSGISSVHLIVEGAGLPTPEGREGLVRLMNAHADQLACVAVVVGGTGFWASAIRSLITGMRAMSSRAYELRLVGHIDEVVSWLPAPHAARSGITLAPADLARVLGAASDWEAGKPLPPKW